MTVTAGSGETRLVYLDWIRVGAFALLILYHIGMFYVTWDWHVKSDHAGHAIEPLMLFTNPWRLTLLFLVSGAATRFMADKLTAGALAGKRTLRLLVPLVFAMLVIVPPQSYYEVIESTGYDRSYLHFWSRYLAADPGFCDAEGCLELPTWNHLWFVAYLLVYTLILAILLRVAGRPLISFGEAFAERMRGLRLLILPILFLAAARLWLLPRFEVTHGLIDDWYNHCVSFTAFLLGFLVLRERSVEADCIRLRWLALGLAIASYLLYANYAWSYRAEDATPPEALRSAMRIIFAIDQWAAIVALLGFGALHLNRDSRLLRALTVAVFPAYIVHQTVIVVAGHELKSLALPVAVEALTLVALTAAGCWFAFELARRVTLLGPLLGVGPSKPVRRGATLDRGRAGY